MRATKQMPAAEELAVHVDQASRGLELADPDAGLLPVARMINRSVEAAGVGLLAAIMLIIFANAFGRYALNHSLVWAEEVVIALIPWLAVCGLFLSVRRRQLVRIEYFADGFAPPVRATINALGQLLCVIVLLYLAWVSLQYVQIFGGDRTPYLGLPKGLTSSAFVVGGALAALAFLATLVDEVRKGRGR
jgi:TRAP-type C4-dicarboxylate transport system permease small subunit